MQGKCCVSAAIVHLRCPFGLDLLCYTCSCSRRFVPFVTIPRSPLFVHIHRPTSSSLPLDFLTGPVYIFSPPNPHPLCIICRYQPTFWEALMPSQLIDIVMPFPHGFLLSESAFWPQDHDDRTCLISFLRDSKSSQILDCYSRPLRPNHRCLLMPAQETREDEEEI